MKRTCILYFVPVIVFNMLFTRHLPEQYLADISHWVIYAECVVRILLMALSFLMLIDTKSRTGRLGIGVYVSGLAIYIASWIILLCNIATDNMIVLLSGYWSAVIWLVGIGLSSDKLWIRMPWRRWFYIVLSVLFGVFHTWHGYLLLG